MKKSLFKNKFSRKVLIGVSTGLVVCSVIPGVSYALATQFKPQVDRYAAMNEYYKNLTMDDVKEFVFDAIQTYDYALKTNADYAQARADGKDKEYLAEFTTNINFLYEEKKSLGYTPVEVFELVNQSSEQYKLQVLDWKYANDQQQSYIDKMAYDINSNPNMSESDKKDIIAKLTKIVNDEFATAREQGLPATSFVTHFSETISKLIAEKQGELVEKAETSSALASLLGSIDFLSNSFVSATDKSIELKNLTVGSDITNLIEYLFTFNGYGITTNILPGYTLTAKVRKISKINEFQFSLGVDFFLIKDNSKHFSEPPVTIEQPEFDIYDSHVVQNAKLVADVLGNPGFIVPVTGTMEKRLIAYKDFMARYKQNNDMTGSTVIENDLLNEIIQVNMPETYKIFFKEFQPENSSVESMFSLRTNLVSNDETTKKITITTSIIRNATEKSKEEVVGTTAELVLELSLSLEEIREFLTNQIELLASFIVDSTKTCGTVDYFTSDRLSETQRLFDYSIFSLTVSVASVVFYTTMAILAAVTMAVTLGATVYEFITNTISAALSVYSVALSSIKIDKIRRDLGDMKTVRTNENFLKTESALKNNDSPKRKRMLAESERISKLFKECSKKDDETLPIDGFIKKFGGEYESSKLEMTSTRVSKISLEILQEFYAADGNENYIFVSNSEHLNKYLLNWQDWALTGMKIAQKFFQAMSEAQIMYKILSSGKSILYSLSNYFVLYAKSIVTDAMAGFRTLMTTLLADYGGITGKWSYAMRTIWGGNGGIIQRIKQMVRFTIQRIFGSAVQTTQDLVKVQKTISSINLNPYVIVVTVILTLAGIVDTIVNVSIK